jgi:hypothetical protein
MMWAAAALVVLPVWTLAGLVPVAVWNRRRARRAPGSFACKLREIHEIDRSDPWARPRHGYPRLVSTGWWVRDVLAVQSGVGLTSALLLPVAASDTVRPLGPGRVRGLGLIPRSVLLLLTDGRLIEVVVARADARLLAGPLATTTPSRRPGRT